MNDPHGPLIEDHDCDGIQELDNVLPRWWVLLFYITIVFGVAYLLYYEVLDLGSTAREKYEQDVSVAEVRRLELEEKAFSDPNLAASTDPSVIAQGQAIYLKTTVACFTCHGKEGQGHMIGPNLCDDHFIHGSKFADTVRIIRKGVLEKGMVAWDKNLTTDQIIAVASYVYSLRETRPENAKPPQGWKDGEDMTRPGKEVPPGSWIPPAL